MGREQRQVFASFSARVKRRSVVGQGNNGQVEWVHEDARTERYCLVISWYEQNTSL